MTITKYGIAPDAEDFEKEAAEGSDEPKAVAVLCKCGLPVGATHNCTTPDHPPISANGATSSTT